MPTAYSNANLGGVNGTAQNGGLFFVDSEGDFGVTRLGGTDNDGTVYKIDAGDHAFTTLYSFTGGTDGYGPAGPPAVEHIARLS